MFIYNKKAWHKLKAVKNMLKPNFLSLITGQEVFLCGGGGGSLIFTEKIKSI